MAVRLPGFLRMGPGSSNLLVPLFFGVSDGSPRTGFIGQALDPQIIEPLDPPVNRSLASVLLHTDSRHFLARIYQPDLFGSFHLDRWCGL